MADKKADTLKNFFHEKAMFIHMGGSWGICPSHICLHLLPLAQLQTRIHTSLKL
jgi:hypothetical protein